MSNYMIDTMTWSYSRLKSYLQCPYQFFMKYIHRCEESPMFFSEYGGLVHDILAHYYDVEGFPMVDAQAALTAFLLRFQSEAVGACPSESIRLSFFRQGIDCMKNLRPIDGDVLCIERKYDFEIGGRPFVGFVDLVYEAADTHALCIVDHKSRNLKPRSNRKKPTKTNQELDEYLRQLYLYSIPVAAEFGRFPDFLEFDCYRTGAWIKEPFRRDRLEEAKQWALDTIEAIRSTKDWKPDPDLDFWKCKYLCGLCDQCEYAQMADWKQR